MWNWVIKRLCGAKIREKTCKIPTPSTGPPQLFLHLVPVEPQQEKGSLTGKTRKYDGGNGSGDEGRRDKRGETLERKGGRTTGVK